MASLTYAQMVLEAVIKLKSRSGSSQPAILKYVKSHFDVNGRSVKDSVARAIRGLVPVHLQRVKASYKITAKGRERVTRCLENV